MRYNKRVNPWQKFFKVSQVKDIEKNTFPRDRRKKHDTKTTGMVTENTAYVLRHAGRNQFDVRSKAGNSSSGGVAFATIILRTAQRG